MPQAQEPMSAAFRGGTLKFIANYITFEKFQKDEGHYDDSDDDFCGLKPHKKKERNGFVGNNIEFKGFGNTFIDKCTEYPEFEPKIVKHTPPSRTVVVKRKK